MYDTVSSADCQGPLATLPAIQTVGEGLESPGDDGRNLWEREPRGIGGGRQLEQMGEDSKAWHPLHSDLIGITAGRHRRKR
jgi:hypothetical protein